MARLTRRAFLASASAAAVAASFPMPLYAQGQPSVVIIGGGFGGTSMARALRRLDPDVKVTLVERDSQFVTCPYSNLVIGGLRTMESITFGYDGVKAAGVEVIHDTATAIDPAARTVTLAGGTSLPYDRLVLAPGIQINWSGLEGYDQAAAEIMPHAWMAGPQTMLLRQKLEAMEDGGLVVISAPETPFRCPPGPYERASMIAHYLKQNKPRSKLLVLDSKEKFSKQGLFQEAWAALYPGLLEWIPNSQSGRVIKVDAGSMTVTTDFEEFKPAVANIIPPHRAGEIAIALGLDDGKNFCAVDPRTFESKMQAGIHLVGDSIVAGAMPKSGFSANSQAKVAARAIVALLRERPIDDAVLLNTCYSTVAPDYAFSVAGVYKQTDEGLVEVEGSGGTSPTGATAEVHQTEAAYADSWYANITAEMFG